MKTKFIFLIFFFACQIAFAQTNGISVQGIARDAEKAALVDEQLKFTFEIYEGTNRYYIEEVLIKTDPYGVFSHIIGTGDMLAASKGTFAEIPFGKAHTKLLIKVVYNGDEITISNAPFQYVPYAKSAENGVPTGTIVAFAGTEANVPPGWVLCDGRPLSGVPNSKNLSDIIGANVPNLSGMFLRGTGTSPVNGRSGPALRGTQNDGFETHSITGTAANAGGHSHSLQVDTGGGGDHGWGDLITAEFSVGAIANNLAWTGGVSDHTHSVSGTSSGGIDENRPVNYGVNYIIKL